MSHAVVEADKLATLCQAVETAIIKKRNMEREKVVKEIVQTHNEKGWWARFWSPWGTKDVSFDDIWDALVDARYEWSWQNPWYRANHLGEEAWEIAHRLLRCAKLGIAVTVDSKDLEWLMIYAPPDVVQSVFMSNPYHRAA